MKSTDDKLSNTSPKDYNRTNEKKKIAKANQVES